MGSVSTGEHAVVARPHKAVKTRSLPSGRRRRLVFVAALAAVLGVTAAGFAARNWWRPKVSRGLAAAGFGSHDHDRPDAVCQDHEHGDAHAGHDHAACAEDDHAACAEHDHDAHAGDDAPNSLRLSRQEKKTIGLSLVTVKLGDFDRTVTVPATVERPGRTKIRVSAPMTGIVARIYPIPGEAVTPGRPLFDIRLTHEDLVAIQSEFLQTVEQLDVIKREVARLDEITSSGVIAGKTLLERKYERQKTEALLRAQRQALILHGLTGAQVDEISSSRKLLQAVTIYTPQPVEKPDEGAGEKFLLVSEVGVEQGQQVAAGEPLCALTDHAELYIEGKAFEEDARELNQAAKLGAPITAVVRETGRQPQPVPGLRILYVENEIELKSRALRFYVRLPNQLVRNDQTADGHRFISWRYRPGQRVELLVPVERWKDRIVLPVAAVVTEGTEAFVYRQDGSRFVRQPVHVEHRDQLWAVLGNTGDLAPGEVLAASGAYQIHLALKNKTGGDKETAHVGCSH